MKKNYLFTSESVSEGHPDKVADQISDAILDECLRQDPESKVACETFCSTGLVVIGGEITTKAYVDVQQTARRVICRIGYDKADYMFDGNSCGVLSAIHEQSADINRGVVRIDPAEQGAGDQGMMFGYACKDTREFMPLPISLAHKILQILTDIRKNEPGLMPYLRPDAKSQFTIEYNGETNRPVRIHTIVLSTQHNEFDTDEAMHDRITADVRNILIPRLVQSLPAQTAALFDKDFELLVALNVFNEALMNDADYKFKRYEDASLIYTGIDKHTGTVIGLWDTAIDTAITEKSNGGGIEDDSAISSNAIENSEPEDAPWELIKVGDIVTHKSLGSGEVMALDDKYVIIKFSDRESKFLYPGAFEKGYLAFSLTGPGDCN